MRALVDDFHVVPVRAVKGGNDMSARHKLVPIERSIDMFRLCEVNDEERVRFFLVVSIVDDVFVVI